MKITSSYRIYIFLLVILQQSLTGSQQLILENKRNNNCSYQDCRQSYTQWSFKDRIQSAFLPCYLSGITCVSREIGVCIGSCVFSEKYSCNQVHEMVWCSRDMWFTCRANNVVDGCCSAGLTATSGLTIAGVVVGLCILAPWCKKEKPYLCCFKKEKVTSPIPMIMN